MEIQEKIDDSIVILAVSGEIDRNQSRPATVSIALSRGNT
jgi:hypothetical protein